MAQPQGRALFSGLYVNELMLKLTVREDPLPELYDALAEVMEAVCCKAAYIDDLRRFEWRLLNLLGVAPICTPTARAAIFWRTKPTG